MNSQLHTCWVEKNKFVYLLEFEHKTSNFDTDCLIFLLNKLVIYIVDFRLSILIREINDIKKINLKKNNWKENWIHKGIWTQGLNLASCNLTLNHVILWLCLNAQSYYLLWTMLYYHYA